VRLEGLGKLKNPDDLIWNRTCDLPACSVVPQPTMLPRGPLIYIYIYVHKQYNLHCGVTELLLNQHLSLAFIQVKRLVSAAYDRLQVYGCMQ
jgi:hypothetical protein